MTNQELNKELTIDQIENDLLYLNKRFPKEAVEAAITQQANITPKLLAWLDKAIEDVDSVQDNDIGHLFSVFLLSQFQEKSAFTSIIKLARLPEEELDSLIGDCITEDLHRFIAATYNGDLLAIKNLIEDINVNEWSRKAGLKSLVILANEGQIDIDETVHYMTSLFTHPAFANDDDQITHLVTACCDFLPHRFENEIQQAFKEDKVDTFVIDMADVKRSLAREKPKYISEHYTLITDTVAEMEYWPCFKEPKKHDSLAKPFNPNWFENLPDSMVSKQIVRSAPKIGRNDPCPCDSGKKYKKCCLLLATNDS